MAKKGLATTWERLRAIDPENRRLSIKRQSRLLGVHRSSYYYKHRCEPIRDREEKVALREAFLRIPYNGYRKMWRELRESGIQTSEKRVRRLMYQLGLKGLSPKKLTSIRSKSHAIHPYLLRNKRIRYPNQVWATDITYLKLETGHVYLCAIMDVYSRTVLSWQISQTMDTDFFLEALKEAFCQ